MMSPRAAVTVFVLAAGLTGMVGCGDDKKADVPKDLNQPLPPPPVGTGGSGKLKGKDTSKDQGPRASEQ
jgi:hypothetical protein